MIPFSLARIPHTIFSPGCLNQITELDLVKKARNVLLFTGANSFRKSNPYDKLINQLKHCGVNIYETMVSQEPSPQLVDEQVKLHKGHAIDLLIAIGGGSVIDAGKAVSAMLTQKESVMAYIEGVGEGKQHNGDKIPFIAVPTTSGTGSEVTKNAVLSHIGEDGFKKSLRHDNFIPEIAMIDPQLILTCPANVSAASGLDALTQLLGSYVSTQASPMTDALALSGLSMIPTNLIPICTSQYDNIRKRSSIAYAAYCSGITLANAGLGIVHGFASSIGGFYDIPHGVICGTLLAEAVRLNVDLLLESERNNEIFLRKYAKVGALLTGCEETNVNLSCQKLIEVLYQWTEDLKIPKLGQYGVTEKDAKKIIKITSNKNNPIALTDEQKINLLIHRL